MKPSSLLPLLFIASILCATNTRAGDKDVADILIKDGVNIKFDNTGTAVSALFAGKDMKDVVPSVAHFKLLGQLKNLKTLTVYSSCPLTDDTIGVLDGLTEMESASINSMNLSDKGFEHLANWKSLKKLTLWHTFNKTFNGSGLAQLATLPKLESLNCSGSTFNDEGLKACAQLKQISTLVLGHTAATSAGLVHLKTLENLKELTLTTQFSQKIDDSAMEHLAAIPNLEKLTLGEMLLTNWGLKHLKELKKLKELSLKDVEISDADLATLKADLPGVNIGVTKAKPEMVEKMKSEAGRKKKR